METAVESTASQAPKSLLEDNGLGMGDFLQPSVPDAEVAPTTEKTEPVAEPAKEPVEAKKEPEQEPAKETEKPDAKDDEVKSLKKQLKDTRDAFTQERQLRKETERSIHALTQSVDVLRKKVDGTYDETKDAPRAPSLEDVELATSQKERIRTSHFAAIEHYGEEFVQKTVWNDDAPYRELEKDPAVQARVNNARLPVMEAIKVVKEAETRKKYGSDPDAMRAALTKELMPELEKEVRKKVMDELKGKGVRPLETVKGLGGIPSVGETKPGEAAPMKFDSLFPNFDRTAG